MKKLDFSLVGHALILLLINVPLILNAQNNTNQYFGRPINGKGFSQNSGTSSLSISNVKASYFIENKGQLADSNGNVIKEIKFYGEFNGIRFYITKKGIKYEYNQLDTGSIDTSKVGIAHSCEALKNKKFKSHTVEMELIDANSSATISKVDSGAILFNYYYSHCPKGILGVKGYSTITIKDIYTKVDLKLYHHEGNLKYDFIVRPGGNKDKIKMKFKGYNSLKIDSKGSLVVTNPFGILNENAPLTYNITKGKKSIVSSKFNIKKDIVTFNVSQYNVSDTLIIDPTRIWSTYLGNTDWDLAHAITTDDENNVYIGGHTFNNSSASAGIISSSNTNVSYIGDVQNDGLVAKFNSNGELKWVTYFGGDYWDDIYAVAKGSGNALYFAGMWSYSSTIPDVFLGSINCENGIRIWQNILGASTSADKGWGIAVGKDGNIYVTGETSSPNLATSNVYQSSPNNTDAFIAKYDKQGNKVMFTYFGGLGTEIGYGIALDDNNDIYITGATTSNSNISSTGSLQGSDDGFIAKFSNSGGVKYWATYYGRSYNSSDTDVGRGITLDKFKNIYVAGYLYLSDINRRKGFLIKLDKDGNLIWEKILGGQEGDALRCVSINKNGTNNIYVAGYTPSSTFQIKEAYQSAYGGGVYDAIFAEFDEFGNLLFSSYYGGSGKETFDAIACDNIGNVYIAGETSTNHSSGIIASTGAYQPDYKGGTDGGDMMIVKFDFNKCNNNIFTNHFSKIVSAIATGTCPINSLEIQFDKNILCSSVQVSDFALAVDGQDVAISSISSNLLTAGATYSTIFKISFQNAILSHQNVELKLNGEIKDICGKLLPQQVIPVNYSFDPDLAIVSDAGTFCDTEKIKLCANGTYSNYVWTKDGKVLPGINTQCIEVSEPGNYSISVTSSGCIKIAIPVNIN